MSPPSYTDLGKQARDVLNKNYHFSQFKLECKTKTESGIELNVTGVSHSDARVLAVLETKYKVPEYGLTFKEKWDTTNCLYTDISIDDQLIKGLTLAFDSTFIPQSGKRDGTFKTIFKTEYVHLNSAVDLNLKGPTIHGSCVLGYKGILAGVQTSLDTVKSSVKRLNAALGYTTDDFTLHTSVDNGGKFRGSLFQKINSNLDVGANMFWTLEDSAPKFDLGCVYTFDKNTSLRGKVNNSNQIGLGITHKLKDGIQLTLSALIDGRNINQGGHKMGLGLNLES